ncbi:hypothetical protein O181_077356 [Austropuccinia psidii MF-1]|uniref:dihydroneopterin aldolase n=1 Tax=Austropuccinia psidii MF-1 TaxID=1389203 RepID=A0A9Q3IC08_9BASI|nr:hypothetical protein [Austropuccinia psidii MF-1]
MSIERDTVFLRSLAIAPWIKANDLTKISSSFVQQPGLVHLRVMPPDGFSRSIHCDQLESDTVSYFDLAELILARVNQARASFGSIDDLAESLANAIMDKYIGMSLVDQSSKQGVMDFELAIELPKAIKSSSGLSILIKRSLLSNQEQERSMFDQISINQIRLVTLIGVLEHERITKQEVVVTLTLWKTTRSDRIDCQRLAELVSVNVTRSSFFTVEALAHFIATNLLSVETNQAAKFIERVRVRVEKPEAVPLALGSGVEITISKKALV